MNSSNLQFMKQLVLNGPNKHPWANFVEIYGRTRKKFLRFADRKEMAKHLVERHIIDRQHSLHRISIVADRAKVLEGRTFRFNEPVLDSD